MKSLLRAKRQIIQLVMYIASPTSTFSLMFKDDAAGKNTFFRIHLPFCSKSFKINKFSLKINLNKIILFLG